MNVLRKQKLNWIKVIALLTGAVLFLGAVTIVLMVVGKKEVGDNKIVSKFKPISCGQLEEAYFKDRDDYQPLVQDARVQLRKISNQRELKQKVSNTSYQNLIQKTVFKSPLMLLSSLNGLACYPLAFIRSDLPFWAEKFVQRHELVHLLGEGVHAVDGFISEDRGAIFKNEELRANLEAARVYPLGFVQTILLTAKNIWQSYDCSVACRTFVLWRGFQKNFLLRSS